MEQEKFTGGSGVGDKGKINTVRKSGSSVDLIESRPYLKTIDFIDRLYIFAGFDLNPGKILQQEIFFLGNKFLRSSVLISVLFCHLDAPFLGCLLDCLKSPSISLPL